MIGLNILDKLDVIEETSVRASKEHGIRLDLDKMYKEWAEFDFNLITLKNNDTYIFKNIDTCINSIDESMTVTLNLFYSPYKSVFEEEINKWNTEITMVSEVLEKILKLQLNYMYLQPIFNSNDIKKSLFNYYKMFKVVDTRWRQNMTNVQKTTNVFKFCNDAQLAQDISEDITTLSKV
jgi:dynein heavy chain